MKAGLIVLPDEVHGREDLVKQIAAKIRQRSPSESRYEELRRMGLDNETAREASGWYGISDNPVEQAVETVRSATLYDDPSDRVKYVAAVETQSSMRRVGEAAGAAVGSAVGLGLLRAATAHSTKLVFGGTVLAGGAIAVIGGQVVAATLGKVATVLFVANVALATGVFAFALARRR